MRESRVRNPLVRRDERSSGLKRAMARDKPMRTAPDCPPAPPPCAVTTTSTWSVKLVNLSGSVASCFHAKLVKYTSTGRPFTVNLPPPGRKNTRATDSLRRPVPWNHVLLSETGIPAVLNTPPLATRKPSLYGPRQLGRRTQKTSRRFAPC